MPEEKEQTPLVAAEQSLEAAIANLTKALGEIDVKAAVMKAIIALLDQAGTLFKPYNHLKDFFKHAKHQPNESTETDND